MLGVMEFAQHTGPVSRLLDADVSWARMAHTDKLTWLSRALSLIGFGLAAYLTTVYLQDVPPLCGTSGGCVTVQHSQYAHLAGIPLPVLGLVGYGLLFITASIGLTYVELNVIHAICLWCVGSATCALFHVFVNSTRYVRGEPNVGGGFTAAELPRE